jgi:GTP-binding protein EngB required for normal cell division
VQAVTQEIEERSVKLKLTIVDTPGFGDSLNNENSWQKAVEYIEAQFQSYLEQVCFQTVALAYIHSGLYTRNQCCVRFRGILIARFL